MRTALEVEQTFHDLSLDVRHVRQGEVTLGSDVRWRWTFLGVDMGTVPAALRGVLPWLPPIWSEVDAVPSGTFTGDDDTTVFRQDEAGWHADLPAGWTATVDGQPVLSVDGPLAGQVEFTRGDVRLRARVVEAPGAPARPTVETEPPLLASLGLTGACAMLFAAITWLAPTPTSTLTIASYDQGAREVRLTLPEPPPPPPPASTAIAGGGKAGAPGRAAPGPRNDREIVATAGLVGLLSADGFADASLDDGLQAAVRGMRAGFGGEGPGGTGRLPGDRLGGGGDAETLAMGPGSGRTTLGYGPGLDGKREGGISIAKGDPIVIGTLDRALIDEVIQRHLGQIRYCYQRQLQREPNLSGKVVVRFTIAGDGSVSSSGVKSSTLGSEAVESCVTGRVLRMKFPEPAGRGLVIVSYPFLFTPG